MRTRLVVAAPGRRVPFEDAPRRSITPERPVAVPDTAYYRRRMADGDLKEVPSPVTAAETAFEERDVPSPEKTAVSAPRGASKKGK